MAQTLLQLALTLLIAAQGANVPQSLRDQAVLVANTAITAAQTEISVKSIAIIPVATSTPKQTGPGYYADDGCFYAAPIGSPSITARRGGRKTWCPSK